MNIDDTITLHRPVGPEELELIRQAGLGALPPCLPEQPVFCRVPHEAYAAMIGNTEIVAEFSRPEAG